MKKITVEEMFECPFLGQEAYSYSEYTQGVYDVCNILKSDCSLEDCPLRKEGEIKVVWNRKD